MRLPRPAATRPFRAGFGGGLLLFAAANGRSYWRNPCFYEEGQCFFGFPFSCGYGFPFSPLDGGQMPFNSEIIWGGLVANFFVMVIASALLGLLCDKLFRSRPAFK